MQDKLLGNTFGTARDVYFKPNLQAYTGLTNPFETSFSIEDGSNYHSSLSGLRISAAANQDPNGTLHTATERGTLDISDRAWGDIGYNYAPYLNYNLAQNAIADYAGNSPDAARNVGSLTHNQTYSYSDRVGRLDTNDYYSFRLAGQSNFYLDLNGLSANADVELLSSSNQVIASSILGGTSSEAIDINGLLAGNYYIRIYQHHRNTNYNLSLSTEYTRIDGTVSNRGPLPWDRVETRPVNIRVTGNSSFQNITDIETWIVVHGHTNSPDTPTISALEEAIAGLGYQVLVLDWSSPANNSVIRPDLSARWIHEVANFAVGALRDIWGIASSNINLIGHSLGSYVSSEIGSLFEGVNRIFALDPAASSSLGGYDINGLQQGFQEISEFDDVSNFARAFWGSGNPITGGEGLGSERYAHSADESFRIDFTSSNNAIDNHGNIVKLFTYMIGDSTNPISSLFHLDRGTQNYWDLFDNDDEGVIIVNGQNQPDRLYFLTPLETWSGAQSRAVAAGGNLVTINDVDEQTWLSSAFDNRSYWIGLTDSERYGASEGNFKWVSGEDVTFTNWRLGEPNNVPYTPDGEDFVQVIGGDIIIANLWWNDLPDDPLTTIGNGWQRVRGMVEVA